MDYAARVRPSPQMMEMTMMDTHTPGPWRVETVKEKPSGNIVTQNRNICCIPFWDGAQDAANARLIAAAPELLAALKTLDEAGRKLLPGPIGGPGTLSPEWEAERAALVDARAAILKAETRP